MAATKFLDAVARTPDCDGEDSDAVGAYTQVELHKIQHLMGNGKKFIDTWVKLPKSQCPKERFELGYVETVAPLWRNLYGHKLAGPFMAEVR